MRQPKIQQDGFCLKYRTNVYAPHRGFCRKSRQSVSTSAKVNSRLDLDTTKPMKSRRISSASPCGRRAPSSFKDRGSRVPVPTPPPPVLATLPRLSARLALTPASRAAVCAFARYRRSSCSEQKKVNRTEQRGSMSTVREGGGGSMRRSSPGRETRARYHRQVPIQLSASIGLGVCKVVLRIVLRLRGEGSNVEAYCTYNPIVSSISYVYQTRSRLPGAKPLKLQVLYPMYGGQRVAARSKPQRSLHTCP